MEPDTGREIRLSGETKNRRPWMVSIFMLISLVLALGSIALAQRGAGEAEGKKPYKLPPNLLRYFKDKYVHVDDFLISTLQETPNGPLGHINLRGEIVPAVATEGDSREERARATALAFIREEAELLDLPNPAELKEVSFRISESGEARIDYVRHIGGLQLLETLIHISVGPDGAITWVNATLRPVSPELYEAVSRKTLAKKEVMEIIERNLAPPGGKILVRMKWEPSRFATWRPPYVVWMVAASAGDKPAWGYTIDAFTGEILAKNCTAHTIHNIGNSTPCD